MFGDRGNICYGLRPMVVIGWTEKQLRQAPSVVVGRRATRLQRPIEAFALAEGLGRVGLAMQHPDPQVQQPDRQGGEGGGRGHGPRAGRCPPAVRRAGCSAGRWRCGGSGRSGSAHRDMSAPRASTGRGPPGPSGGGSGPRCCWGDGPCSPSATSHSVGRARSADRTGARRSHQEVLHLKCESTFP